MSNDFWPGTRCGHVLRILLTVVGAGGHFVLLGGCFAGECNSDAACDDGKFCTGIEACQLFIFIPFFGGITKSCGSPGSPCSGSTPICDEAENRCLPCEGDAQCDDLAGCTDDSCDMATGECKHIDNCVDNGIFCDGTAFCVLPYGNCASERPCFGTTPVCDETLKSCLPCERDDQCPPSIGLCVIATGECIYPPCCPDDEDPCTWLSCDDCQLRPFDCQRSEDCPGGCTCNDGLCSGE